jgi:hypothetical protein
MWPFPVNTQWKDPSLLMISVARSAAMQNGLHQPETMQEFSRVKTQLAPAEFRATVKLWAGCYIAGQRLFRSSFINKFNLEIASNSRAVLRLARANHLCFHAIGLSTELAKLEIIIPYPIT